MASSISKRMKMEMNIFDLPPEILAKVINFAENKDIRLVCKHFYEVYSEFTLCKVTFKFDLIPDDIFNSMIFSLRRATQFTFVNANIRFDDKFKKAIFHFAADVKELTFKGQTIPMEQFVYIMRSMTNLVMLAVEDLKIDATRYRIGQMKQSPIILPHLSKLSVTYYDSKSMWIVMCVQSNLLEEFHFHGNNIYDFTPFFERHRTIKKVTLSGKLRHSKGYEHLQLTHLCVYNSKNEFLHEMIAHQPALKHLELLYRKDLVRAVPFGRIHWPDDSFYYQLTVDDNVFQAICDLTRLETLSIQIGRLTATVVANISKLINLKKLVVKPSTQGGCNQKISSGDVVDFERACLRCEPYKEIFRTFIATPLLTLESFTWSSKACGIGFMEHMKTIDLGSSQIVQMAQSFPTLKHLAIQMGDKHSRGDKINVNEILQACEQLKSLELQISSIGDGSSAQMHNNIECMRIEMLDGVHFDSMMRTISMPKLHSLEGIGKVKLEKTFLLNFLATIPSNLKNLQLNFTCDDEAELIVGNFNILREIFERLQRCKITIFSCDYDMATKITKLADGKMKYSVESRMVDLWLKTVTYDVILWK